ncbi:MarR family transcriptional regulator [Polaromonas sp. P1(28)-8]|nr:MarR family transcriptional regulator [Polaromonas sp. P1(28)-8]
MNDSIMLSGSLLREVARLYTRAQRVVADCCRTTNTQCMLLTELGRSGPLALSELGKRVCLEKSWVSRAVDGLVQRGLATKEANPQDARSWLVTLTDDGVERVRDLNQTLDVHAEQLLGSLSQRDRKTVESSLLLLMKALREDAAATCCLPPPDRKESKC